MYITLENGANGAIVADGNALTINADVITTASQNGTYLDIIGGNRNGDAVEINLTISGGTYQNIMVQGLSGSTVELGENVVVVEATMNAGRTR